MITCTHTHTNHNLSGDSLSTARNRHLTVWNLWCLPLDLRAASVPVFLQDGFRERATESHNKHIISLCMDSGTSLIWTPKRHYWGVLSWNSPLTWETVHTYCGRAQRTDLCTGDDRALCTLFFRWLAVLCRNPNWRNTHTLAVHFAPTADNTEKIGKC